MNSYLVNMFKKLDQLHEKYKQDEESPTYLKEIKKEKKKIEDIKQYKKEYYVKNYEVYKERNRNYREKVKQEKEEKKLI